jgi:tRNA-binding EMAP/Myf-like protein
MGARSSILGGKGEYSKNDLIGRFVVAVVNLQRKSIAGVISEVLILGAPAADDKIVPLAAG